MCAAKVRNLSGHRSSARVWRGSSKPGAFRYPCQTHGPPARRDVPDTAGQERVRSAARPQQGCPKVGICPGTRALTGAFQLHQSKPYPPFPPTPRMDSSSPCPGRRSSILFRTCTCPTTVVEACRQDHGFRLWRLPDDLSHGARAADFPCTCLTLAEGVVRCGITASNEASACAIPCETSAQCAQRLGAETSSASSTPAARHPCVSSRANSWLTAPRGSSGAVSLGSSTPTSSSAACAPAISRRSCPFAPDHRQDHPGGPHVRPHRSRPGAARAGGGGRATVAGLLGSPDAQVPASVTPTSRPVPRPTRRSPSASGSSVPTRRPWSRWWSSSGSRWPTSPPVRPPSKSTRR